MASRLEERTREAVAPAAPNAAGLLTFTLWVGLIDALAFGALIFFAPAFIVENLAEAAAFPYFAIRWAGGMLLALLVGTIWMLRKPKGQMAMFTTFATANLMAGIGMVWSWLADEYTGVNWFLIVALIGTLGVSALQWFTLYRAKGILG